MTLHGFHKSLGRRLEALEDFIGHLPEPISAEEQERLDARSEQLADASLQDLPPEAITPPLVGDEHRVYAEMRRFRPILLEMLEEGIIDVEGRPRAPLATRRDALDPEDDDLDDDKEGL